MFADQFPKVSLRFVVLVFLDRGMEVWQRSIGNLEAYQSCQEVVVLVEEVHA